MAKGIISSKPSTTMPKGKAVVTEGKSTTTGDGTTAPLSYDSGTVLEFTNSITANIGDLVDFSIDSRGQLIVNSVIKAGKVISANLDDNLVVSAGESVLVTGKVDGKVNVNGGFLVITDGARIGGKIDSNTAGSFLYAGIANIDGKIEFTGASNLSLQGAIIEGKVYSDGNLFASIVGCTIDGKLDVTNAVTCKCSGNTADDTNTPGCL